MQALWALGAICWWPILDDTLNVPLPFLAALAWPFVGVVAIAMWAWQVTVGVAAALCDWWWADKNEKAPPKERPIDPEEG